MVVLIMGVLLILTALFLVALTVRVYTQQQDRPQLDRTRPNHGPGRAGTVARQAREGPLLLRSRSALGVRGATAEAVPRS